MHNRGTQLCEAPLSSADPPKDGEAAGEHVEQILAIGGGLPIFAHRNVGHILPQLQLQLGADPPLFIQTGSVEPSSAQGFDALARRPADPSGKPIRSGSNCCQKDWC